MQRLKAALQKERADLCVVQIADWERHEALVVQRAFVTEKQMMRRENHGYVKKFSLSALQNGLPSG
jgi:hypothetical protein